MYIKDSLDAKLCTDAVQTDDRRFELLWIQVQHGDRTLVIGALYHPPKPLYSQAELLQELERSLDAIIKSPDDTVVVLAGDFNQLPDSAIQQLGLLQLFTGPSHAGHCLDRIYSSEPLQYQCRAVTSTVKTQHKAVIACESKQRIVDINKSRTVHNYRTRTPTQHAALLQYLSVKKWDDISKPIR